MPFPLSDQVIVITGASSGIGRTTALAAAKRGTTVALLARNEVALQEVTREVATAGGKALTVVTDVSDYAQVERAVAIVLEHFGRIDTWVNNAGVYAVAPFENMTVEEFEQVIRVNFFGTVHGSKAVLPHFIERKQGALINVSSVVGVRGAPLLSAYVASKHAIKGFTESLRLELARDHPGISVTTILPASINTPIFTHALGRIGVKPRPLPPVYAPDLVADAILDSAVHPKRDVFVGAGRSMAMLEGIAPSMLDRALLTGGLGFRAQTTDAPDDNENNLFAPMSPETYGAQGEWTDKMRGNSIGLRLVELHPARTRAVVGAAAAAALFAVSRRIH